jgi:hypothetical protein
MPVHDWTRVEAGIFHAFHTAWIGEIQNALNEGLLPEGYYALAEQHLGSFVPDILTLHAPPGPVDPIRVERGEGGTAVIDAPPQVRRRQTIDPVAFTRQRTLAIRHISGHRVVALLEIVSPANKDRPEHVEQFVQKAVNALDAGIHLLIVDLFPPGPHDAHGMHSIIRQKLDLSDEPYDLPSAEPLTLASYAVGPGVDMYLEHLAPGAPLPEMPLFLSCERYIGAPLESTYAEAYRGMPSFWRDVLEGKSP